MIAIENTSHMWLRLQNVIFFKFVILVKGAHRDYICWVPQLPSCTTEYEVLYLLVYKNTLRDIDVPTNITTPFSVHSACILYSEVISYEGNRKWWQPQKMVWCHIFW
jgi:hypothetical protein